MINIIITSKKESTTIQRAITCIGDVNYSGYADRIKIIQVSPDSETLDEGLACVKNISNKNLDFVQIKDENLGKPHALNKALSMVDSDIVILTDGDVIFEEKALINLINEFKNNKYDIACGKVISSNLRTDFMGYISHMMTAAADHKRKIIINKDTSGRGSTFVEKGEFFPLSGYMLIFNKVKLENKLGEGFVFPVDCLVDDAYLSYVAFNYGLKFGYIPSATVRVKFPDNLKDYMLQKKRSTGGYIQLWKYGVVKNNTKSRSFWHDLRYFWFPIKFAQNFKEYYWSIIFYPIRFLLWIQIYLERKVLHKNFNDTWVRIESTK